MQSKTIQKRIISIDILRGIAMVVMVVMALDHVRDYFHIHAWTDNPMNLDTTTSSLFFTRYITHFCAPTFVFLSGVSIYLQSLRKTKNELSVFLIKRGLWLIFFGIAILVGSTIGAGILRTPGIIAGLLHNYWLIIACWIVGGLYVLLGVGSYAELATSLPKAGGHYNYVKRAFGNYVGFLIGWFSGCYFAEEDENPGKNIPKSLYTGAIVVISIYIIINMAFFYVLPVSELAHSSLAAYDVAKVVFGENGAIIVTLIVVFR